MQISETQLESFKEVYKKEFGIDLTNKEAYQKASLLLKYVVLCLKPLNTNFEDQEQANFSKGLVNKDLTT